MANQDDMVITPRLAGTGGQQIGRAAETREERSKLPKRRKRGKTLRRASMSRRAARGNFGRSAARGIASRSASGARMASAARATGIVGAVAAAAVVAAIATRRFFGGGKTEGTLQRLKDDLGVSGPIRESAAVQQAFSRLLGQETIRMAIGFHSKQVGKDKAADLIYPSFVAERDRQRTRLKGIDMALQHEEFGTANWVEIMVDTTKKKIEGAVTVARLTMLGKGIRNTIKGWSGK